MMRALRTSTVALSLAAAPVIASGQSPSEGTWQIELGVPVAFLSGHTTYRIEGSDGASSVASELRFPVAGLAAGLDAQLANRPPSGKPRFVADLGVLASFAGASGTLQDSDWLDGDVEISTVGQSHPGLDIYSESHADLQAIILDGRVGWEVRTGSGVVLAPIAGVLHQRFDYHVRDVNQVGYGPYAADYSGSSQGEVLRYHVAYTAPYFGTRVGMGGARLTGSAELWFSPLASADDRDDHLLRSKLSTTDATGTAWQASVSTRFALTARDALEAHASFTRFSATGTQHQRFYAGPDAGLELDIPSHITSSRTSVFLTYARRM